MRAHHLQPQLGQAGLQFSPRPQPPNVLPAMPGLIYFQIRREATNAEWQNVQRSLALALRLNENRIAGNIQGQRVLNITPQEVKEVAKARLRPDNRAVLVYEPVSGEVAEDADPPEDPEAEATVEAGDKNEEAAK